MIYKSCLNYQGNKWKLLVERKIHEFIPRINHDNPYCELMVGSGVMFFNIEAKFAYLNDINSSLQNFWKVITYDYEKFSEILKNAWPGFELEIKSNIEEAVQFYISNINSSFITKPLKVEKSLDFWRNKLNSVRLWVDNRPFQEEISYLTKLYTSNIEERICRVVFYEDPPYYGSEDVYKSWRSDQTTEKLPPFDHDKLAELNQKAKEEGHFILLSYNDCPEIRALYDGWEMISYEYKPNAQLKDGKNQPGRPLARRELIICSEHLVRRHNRKLTEFI